MADVNVLLEKLPTELREKVLSLKPILQEQGCVARRLGEPGRRPYRLRYRAVDSEGERKHCSIDLPDDDAAVHVDAIIRTWQNDFRDQLTSASEKPKPVDHSKLYRSIIGAAATAHGATPNHRRKIVSEYKKAEVGGIRELWRFVVTGQHAQSAKPRGRPAAGRWY